MSKKFTFPLQKALDWYRQSLAVEKASLQRIIHEIQMLDRLKDSLERRRHTELEQLQVGSNMSGVDLRGLGHYSALIRTDLARLAAERMRKEASLAEQRKKVVLHHRRVRVLEQLEQRRKAEWTRSLGVEEDNFASDLFLASIAREANT
jgi:flagellar export protein FliJ